MLSLLVPPVVVIGSLTLATLLLPVERLAISTGRVFSTWVLSAGFLAGLHGIAEQMIGRPRDDRRSAPQVRLAPAARPVENDVP
jgi:hypothetical protein